jgi:hypothetical protein
MDDELHRVPDALGDVQEAFLLAHAAGIDVPYHSICGLSDPLVALPLALLNTRTR